MRNCRAKILDVIAGHTMRIGPQRCGLQTSEHRLEGKRVHPDVAENIFPTEYGGEEIVDLGQQGITTELPGMPAAVELSVSAKCSRCWRVRRGKIVDRP